MGNILVTKSFLPPLTEYVKCLEKIWDSRHITNSGPFVIELEASLQRFLQNKEVYYVSNGTIALQLAIKALGLKGEIITTPFSYVATVSSIAWENCKPVFVDIDASTLTIDPGLIEAAISSRTSAILATHVFGNPCDVDAISKIAKKHNLHVIYDAAHCFGVKFQGKPITSFGDVSTLSFHATKIFHTGEGGAVICNSKGVAHRVEYMRNFGHKGPESFQGLGVNGKNSELHAAMGVCNLPYLPQLILARKRIFEIYDGALIAMTKEVLRPRILLGVESNYSYYPIIFNTERGLLRAITMLNQQNIFPRRYFYPTLTQLEYVKSLPMPIADSISERVLCLPLYHDLPDESALKVAQIILSALMAKD